MGELTYEEWLGEYDDELTIADAESGADREVGYDAESIRENQYDEYVRKNKI